MRFLCVDIAEIQKNDKLEHMIMEVNSGITLEGIVHMIEDGYEVIKNVYKQAIIKMF